MSISFGEGATQKLALSVVLPSSPAEINNAAAALMAQNAWEEAVAILERLTSEHPTYANGWVNLAMSNFGGGRLASAVAAAEAGLRQLPTNLSLQLALATCLLPDDAQGALKVLRESAHSAAVSKVNSGSDLESWRVRDRVACLTARAYEALGEVGRAMAILRATALVNEAGGGVRRRQLLQARSAAMSSGEFFPTLGELAQPDFWPQWESAMILLRHRRWREGFEAYECRLGWWRTRGFTSEQSTREWAGQPLRGKTILVAGEQGYGDQIMFWRFVPLLRELGADVWLGVNAPLKRLAQHWLGSSIQGVVALGDLLPDFNYYVPLCSLPFRLGLDRDTDLSVAAAKCPSLFADKSERQDLLLRVGVCWAGKVTHGADHLRSIHWANMRSLLESSPQGVNWIRVQPGWESHATPGLQLEDTHVRDFADLALLLESLDVLISVDSAPVHLAGSLGLPVCMLDRVSDPDWRWGAGQGDGAPWYQSVQVCRQKLRGDWSQPLANALDFVKRALELRGPAAR